MCSVCTQNIYILEASGGSICSNTALLQVEYGPHSINVITLVHCRSYVPVVLHGQTDFSPSQCLLIRDYRHLFRKQESIG